MTALCLGCERFTDCRNEHFAPYLNDQCRFSKESEMVRLLHDTCWALSDALIKIGDSWHPAYKILDQTKKWFHDHGIEIEERDLTNLPRP